MFKVVRVLSNIIARITRDMVLIHYKKSEQNQFLYTTTLLTSIDQLIKEIVTSMLFLHANSLVNNMRIKLDRLCMAIEELALKGPLKPEELRGLSDYDKYGE